MILFGSPGHAITQMQAEGRLKVIVPWLQRTAVS
jgi:hypothetical protein